MLSRSVDSKRREEVRERRDCGAEVRGLGPYFSTSRLVALRQMTPALRPTVVSPSVRLQSQRGPLCIA